MTHRIVRLVLAGLISAAPAAAVVPGLGDDPHGMFAADQRTYTGGRF